MTRSTSDRRTIAFLLVALLATFAGTTASRAQAPATPKPAAAGNESPVELVPFQAPDESFTVSYPKGWDKAPDAVKGAFPGAVAVFMHASEQGGQPELFAVCAIPTPQAAGANVDFATWAKGFKNGLVGQLPNAKIVSESEITVGKVPALRMIFDNAAAGGNTMRFIQIGFPKGPRAYLLTYLLDPKNFDKFEPLERAVTASFTFNDKAGATPPAPAAETTPATPTPTPTPTPTATATATATATTTATSKPSTGPEVIRWQAADNAFAISTPKGWEKAPDQLAGAFGGGASLVLMNAGEPGGQPDVLAVGTTPAAPLEQIQNPKRPNAPPVYRRDMKTWVKSKKDPLASSPNFKLVTESQATVAGATGIRLVYDAKDAAGNPVRFIRMFLEKGQTEYQISFITDPKRFAKFLPTEQAITRSFVIAPKPGDAPTATATGDATTPTAPATNTDTATTPATPTTPTPTPTIEKPTPTVTTPTPPTPTPAAPAAANTFESPEIGLKFTYPETWAPRKSSAPGMLLMLLPTQVKPGQRPSTLTLTADPFPPGQPPSFKELADSTLTMFKSTAPDAKIVESNDVKINKVPARRITIAGHNSITKADTRGTYLFFNHGQNTLTLSAQSQADEFNALKESVDAAVASIELSIPAAPKKAQ